MKPETLQAKIMNLYSRMGRMDYVNGRISKWWMSRATIRALQGEYEENHLMMASPGLDGGHGQAVWLDYALDRVTLLGIEVMVDDRMTLGTIDLVCGVRVE